MRFLTAGESHGPELTAIIEGVPSQLSLTAEDINKHLARRQKGYGRGRRMQIEKDQVRITSGVRHGKTTGAPITLVVENKDWTHWTKIMGPEPLEPGEEEEVKRKISRPRPGHADLNGALKYRHRDMRNVLERSSARETTVRVAVGAVAQRILEEFGMKIAGHVLEIGDVVAEKNESLTVEDIIALSEASEVRCTDPNAEEKMKQAIDDAKQNGDSIGGIVEVVAENVPVGLGSFVQYDRKLDAKISMSVMSINAFKGVEVGLGFEAARRNGSKVHDEIIYSEGTGYQRRTNNLGGFEGGMTTGMPVVVKGAMKPIPTLYKPLQSVDIETKEPFSASIERSDSCAVPAAAVVCEAAVAWEIADAFLDKFGSDTIPDIHAHLEHYQNEVRDF
ncbi:chorismate synthase [Salisediminibacterium selenitireducens]|uniref:Chorismate synthase n=1 Tax=Bacillus selenitireducens (strain ATCC 700615 / DSM 15326 / MLS10) TaxID=439292 RepID=D6XV95_BACIE|nr:chorismate synthase [Salisediminibacterium selenitireducens]ADH99633.1 chorismate synthase [[Bacillus] selenitireducens MLS10]